MHPDESEVPVEQTPQVPIFSNGGISANLKTTQVAPSSRSGYGNALLAPESANQGSQVPPVGNERRVNGQTFTRQAWNVSRGRSCGRGRARRRASGSRGSTDRRSRRSQQVSHYVLDASAEWTISRMKCEKVQLENDFTASLLDARARPFCRSVVERMKIQLLCRNLPRTRSGFIVLLMNEILRNIMQWFKEKLDLNRSTDDEFTISYL